VNEQKGHTEGGQQSAILETMSNRVSLSSYQAVLFDVDGTLVDTLAVLVRGLGDAFEKYARIRPSDGEIRALIGMPLSEQLSRYRVETPTPSELQEMSRFTISRFEEYKDLERPFEPALEALALFHRQGLRTALVTSKSDVEIALFLKRFSHARYVDTIVCASDVTKPKPHAESALLACSRLRVKPSSALFIGDSVYDIRCARAAGVTAIAVSYGAASKQDLAEEQPALLLETPEALLNWGQTALLEPSCSERRK
jgi:pyrophosphatase PpaX